MVIEGYNLRQSYLIHICLNGRGQGESLIPPHTRGSFSFLCVLLHLAELVLQPLGGDALGALDGQPPDQGLTLVHLSA